jgi:hypothetical protein
LEDSLKERLSLAQTDLNLFLLVMLIGRQPQGTPVIGSNRFEPVSFSTAEWKIQSQKMPVLAGIYLGLFPNSNSDWLLVCRKKGLSLPVF